MIEIALVMRLLILIRGHFEAEIGANMKLSKGASRVTEHWATGFVLVSMECFCFKVPSNQELAMEGGKERERERESERVREREREWERERESERERERCLHVSPVYGMWLIALYKTFQNALPMGMTFTWHARLGGLFAELQSLKSGWEPGSPMTLDSINACDFWSKFLIFLSSDLKHLKPRRYWAMVTPLHSRLMETFHNGGDWDVLKEGSWQQLQGSHSEGVVVCCSYMLTALVPKSFSEFGDIGAGCWLLYTTMSIESIYIYIHIGI